MTTAAVIQIIASIRDSSYYEATKLQALAALQVYPGGLQVGGGITAENAHEFLMAGASHVIVTSYVFRDGKVDYGRLEKLVQAVGKEHLVLDLSCRKKRRCLLYRDRPLAEIYGRVCDRGTAGPAARLCR